MPSNFETGCEALVALAEAKHPANPRNEATTRLQLIDTLLFQCLGWDRFDCKSEERFDGKIADYTLLAPMPVLVVEAKKEGVYFEIPAGFSNTVVKLRTVLELDEQIAAAVRQALGYCQERGVGTGAVCNGHQLIAFLGSRHDGIPPLEGQALVFSSLDLMVSKFRLLWDNLSKPGMEGFNIHKTLKAAAIQPPPEKLSSRISGFPGLKNRNPFQAELRSLGELFIEDIGSAKPLEEEFLTKCYASSGALSQHALVAKNILEARYSLLLQRELQTPTLETVRDKQGLSPQLSAEVVAASLKRRAMILLGDVGVGKSIFIRHFIKIEARSVFERAMALYVDFGKEPALADDLQSFVLRRCKVQLRTEYDVDIDEASFIRGVYYGELIRFSRGIYSDLKTANPNMYKLKELEFLESKISDKAAHLRDSLEHISKGRQQQVIVFLDNIDQRPLSFQDQVFLIGQSFAETWPASVFISLRPETFYQSKTKGSLTGYQPRVFTVAPPRIDVVISNRLTFALEQLRETGRLGTFPPGLSIHSTKLELYLAALIQSFERNPELSEFIDNASGGNVRTALGFVNTFVGSGHVNATKIIQLMEAQGEYFVAIHEFIRAVIYGDLEHYDPNSSPIANLFDITTPDGREHFLLPNILAFIERPAAGTSGEGFVEVTPVFEFAQSLGFNPAQIGAALDRAVKKKLLESGARAGSGDDLLSAFRITTVGAYSIKRLIQTFVYLDAVVVDTPIVDEDARQKIENVSALPDRLNRALVFLEYLDSQSVKLRDRPIAFDWNAAAAPLKVGIERIQRVYEAKRASETVRPIRTERPPQ